MTHNPYVPISQTPWWCVNGHYNAHEREICRYCDVPFTADQRSLAPDVPPPAADSRDTEAERIELAARAICKAWGYEWDVPDDHYCDGLCNYLCSEDADDKPTKSLCREAARAVIASLAASVPEDHDGE